MNTRLEQAVALTRTMLAAVARQDWAAYARAKRGRGELFGDDLYADSDARERLYLLAELQQRLCAALGAERDRALTRSVASRRAAAAIESYGAVSGRGGN